MKTHSKHKPDLSYEGGRNKMESISKNTFKNTFKNFPDLTLLLLKRRLKPN